MIQEYIYEAGMKRAQIIEDTLRAILKTRRPKTFCILNTLRWRWLWKATGIRLHVHKRYKGDLYEEYEVFQFDTLLASFELRQSLTIT